MEAFNSDFLMYSGFRVEPGFAKDKATSIRMFVLSANFFYEK